MDETFRESGNSPPPLNDGFPELLDANGETATLLLPDGRVIQEPPPTAPHGYPREWAGEIQIAEYFKISHFSDDVKFNPDLAQWMAYDGKRWKVDRLEAERAVKKMLWTLVTGNINQPNIEIHSPMAKRATSRLINGILALSASERMLQVRTTDFDINPMVLACQNGVLDLETGILEPFQRDYDVRGYRQDKITRLAGARFEKDADCPLWEDFIEAFTCADDELAVYLQEICGYFLTGQMSEQAFYVLFGGGANGKGTLEKVLRGVMGDYAVTANIKAFCISKNDRNAAEPTPHLIPLIGARLVSMAEPHTQAKLNDGAVKAWTGQDEHQARANYQDEIRFQPVGKLLFSVNNLPKLQDDSEGSWRRVRVIPCNANFENENRREDYHRELLTEKEGILNWCLEGLQWWREETNHTLAAAPGAVRVFVSEYRQEQNVAARFVAECYQKAQGEHVASGEIKKNFASWCKANGEDEPPQSQLYRALDQAGFKADKIGGGTLRVRQNCKARTFGP